ncbi:MAG TPA: class I SAM-dependent methyltransferase [Syntrophobacteraceae bacterium]|nr:class I SAM-dependent methyltransferase [Syntrophobacteraceae bacterium]
MEENCPSRTALHVAIRRALHQVLDNPRIFDDPIALRVLGLESASAQDANRKPLEETPLSRIARALISLSEGYCVQILEENPLSRVLRASLAARSRYAEEELRASIRQGVGQYVVLGAGLDAFAYRNPYPLGVLHVFEVDRPATQIWKRARLEKAGIPYPQTITFAPVDFGDPDS